MDTLHLGYHYIRDEKAPGPNCSPARLRTQIRALLESGYEILTCEEVTDRLRTNRPLPKKYATLSFDDGLRDQYTTAYPILKEFGVPATFFCISCVFDGKLPPVIGFQIAINELGADALRTKILPELFEEYGLWSYERLLQESKFDYSGMKMGEPEEMRLIKAVFNHFVPPSLQAEFVEKIFERGVAESEHSLVEKWFMSADEISEMNRRGMEIGSHSISHPWMNMIGEGEIREQAQLSGERLKKILGNDPQSFAWTFGTATPRKEAVRAVSDTGYKSAWNFWSTEKSMPRLYTERPYGNMFDIPRLHEQVFLPDVK